MHSSWDAYFKLLNAGLPHQAGVFPPSLFLLSKRVQWAAFYPPPTLRGSGGSDVPPAGPTAGAGSGIDASEKEIKDHIKVVHLIRAHQVRGHHLANLDPLKLGRPDLLSAPPPELDLAAYGFTEAGNRFVLLV